MVIDPSTEPQDQVTGNNNISLVVSVLIQILHSVLRECDATIITSSYLYDPVSLGAMQQWFSNMQKEVHVLGPLLPASYSTETQNTEERASIDVEAFLEEMLVQHGKKSVFFVRSIPFLSDLG